MQIDNQNLNTNSQIFLDKLCHYFANIGTTMSNNITPVINQQFKIHNKSCLQTFVFQEITEKLDLLLTT